MAMLLSSLLPGVMLAFSVQPRQRRLADAKGRVVGFDDPIVQ
jgi:hypothetical protein